LPKNLAHGIVEAPGVIKKTVETAVKKGPEQSESIKKLLAALGIGAGVGAGVAGADAARKKLWGDKSITPFGSSGEWGGVLGSKVEKKEEDQPKAAMVNPLMAGIPVATGIKSKDENWDLKKSLLAGIAAGILLKIPKFKPIGSAGLEKTIAGGLTGGVLGGIGHGISSLLRKKPEEEVELGKESALKIVYLSALENFQKIAKATDLNYTDEEVKRAIMKQAEQLEGSKRDITDAEAMAILQEAGKPKWFSGVFSKDPVAKIVGGKGDRNRKKLLEGIVNNYRSIWTGGLKRSAPKLDLAQMIREHANQSGGVG